MTTRADYSTSLNELGHVPPEYRHEWRVATPVEPHSVPGGIFKWYHVHREGIAVPPEMDTEAREIIAGVVADGWDLSYGLNFALLHYSTAQAFLIAGIWRNHQELWERLYVYDLAEDGPFKLLAEGEHDRPAACVWELGVICHERMAWHRYLFSDRDEAAKRAWLADTYSGQV